jgi:hypothetical protein
LLRQETLPGETGRGLLGHEALLGESGRLLLRHGTFSLQFGKIPLRTGRISCGAEAVSAAGGCVLPGAVGALPQEEGDEAL